MEPELPNGWKQEFDEKTRRYYYWNINTSETSWSIPTLSPKHGGDGKGTNKRPMNLEPCSGGQSSSDTDSQEQKGINTNVKEGYTKKRTDSSRMSYLEEFDKHSEKGMDLEPESEDTFQSSSWRKVFDQDSMRTYYWNCETNETCWELPNLRVKKQDSPSISSSGSTEKNLSEVKTKQAKLKEVGAKPTQTLTTKRSFSMRKRRENIAPESMDYTPRTDAQRRKTLVPKSPEIRNALERVLKNHFLFEPLSTLDRFELVDVMSCKEVPAGVDIVRQGDPGEYFYVLESGRLEVLKTDECHDNQTSEAASLPKPDQKLVGRIEAGGCFGELALLYQRDRAATVRSSVPAKLWTLDRATFRHILQESSQHDIASAREALRKVPLLQALTDDQIEQAAYVVRFREFKAGFQIIHKGDIGDVFYIIKSGSVLCSGGLSIHKGKESSIQLNENDYFGERALLKEEPRAANVVAVTDVTVMTLDRHAFTAILGPLREVLDDNIRAFVLQEIPVFRCLSTENRLKIFTSFTTMDYKKGDYIIRQGEIGTTFFVLRSGEAQVLQDVQIPSNKGTLSHEHLLHTLRVGEYFGEMALLDNKERVANVVASMDCTCFCLDTTKFHELLHGAKDILNRDMNRRRRDNLIKHNELSSRIQREQDILRLLQHSNQDLDFQQKNMNVEAGDATGKSKVNDVGSSNGTNGAFSQTPNQHGMPITKEHDDVEIDSNLQMPSRKTNYKLGDFQSVRTLGTGTFGRVKLVRSSTDKKAYALKIQSKYQIVKFKLQQNIMNEKFVMQKLNHPFINCLHQTFQDNDCLYMLLELIQGGELFSLLQTIGPKLKKHHHTFYIACIISAFEAMHHYDILYRDLKPENILIDSLGYLKLVDFGFAKVVKHRTYTLCGTPEYFSPELVLGKGYGKGNDVWGVGILAYEVINGYTPFGGMDDKQNEIYKRVVQDRLLFPKDCYDEVGMHLISALLEKDPLHRLGCGKYGIGAVKEHPWFNDLDWDALVQQKLKAPWVPKLRSSLDASHFDNYDEDYRIVPYFCANPAEDPFRGF